MNYIWGRWYSDEELKQIAREMNELGRSIERKTEGVRVWIKDAQELQAKNPGNLVF